MQVVPSNNRIALQGKIFRVSVRPKTNEIQILFKTEFTSKTDKKNIYLLSAARVAVPVKKLAGKRPDDGLIVP